MYDSQRARSAPSVRLGPDDMSRYPFVADAGEYLRDQGFTLKQFGTDPDLRKIVERAVQRISTAADGGVYRSELDEDDSARGGSVLPLEVFSFLLAVVLLKLAGMNALVRKFALAEARRAERFLEKDLGERRIEKKVNLAIQMIRHISGVEIAKREYEFTIPIPDYIKRSVGFHEREWKLVNRRVWGGSVFLTRHEIVRLVRTELGNYIASKIRSAKMPEMQEGFEDPVGRLIVLAKRFSGAVPVSTEFPPCIKHAIEVLEKGENLSHSGRFMLATFLLNRDQSIEQIAPLFKNAPDYNEKITLYQLNHLAGIGSGTKYMCPSCQKIRSQDLCFAIPECEYIRNPLQFGRRTPDVKK